MINVYTEVPADRIRPGMALADLLANDPRPLVVSDVTHHLTTTEVHGRLPGVTTGPRRRIELDTTSVVRRLPTDGELAAVWALVVEATQGKTTAVTEFDEILDVELVSGEPRFTVSLAGRPGYVPDDLPPIEPI